MKVIEPTQKEWALPIVLVSKKDGTLWFSVAFRKRDAVITTDSYLIPRMEECIDSSGDIRIFSTLDWKSGYWQNEVHRSDREKTEFTSHDDLHQLRRRPIDLHSAPTMFQYVMDVILFTIKRQ